MASFGRSFKPSSYLPSMKRRPPPPSRTMSSSSEASPLSSPNIRQDDIIFSTRPSPNLTVDNPRHNQSGASPKLRPSGGRKDPSLFDSPRSTPARTRPIAIELPTKKVNSAPVYTPPAPLSARGDLPGGYFPLHEDQARVYCPHPFQLDASKARMKSIERANISGSPDSRESIITGAAMGANPSTTGPVTMAEQSTRLAPRNVPSLLGSSSDSVSNTPVASYNPTGTQDNPLPMGKYYPSNYVKRKEEKRNRKQSRPPTSNRMPPPPMISKSETQVPTTRDSSSIGHSRNDSDAKRRLQQYQRDMIAQATLALNGGNVNAATLSSLRTIGFSSMSKPSKPRLAPLGSPGPVTPMELEGSEGGYLGARGPADAQVEQIARAIRAEEERKRREGATSPAVELGPSTF
ncbi:hypothetical protein F5Y06DRAFT_60991 [Hypoxylon sp. FL0890]|nr:hypothetical protein F5Y06DRAFT_60991 [Hypoxylon sp. FL0890]